MLVLVAVVALVLWYFQSQKEQKETSARQAESTTSSPPVASSPASQPAQEATSGNAMAPNPDEEQVRTKIRSVKANMRDMTSPIEYYFSANQAYPPFSSDPATNAFGPFVQQAPVLENQPTFRSDYGHGRPPLPADPFAPAPGAPFCYWVVPSGAAWIIWSAGPDRDYDLSMTNLGLLFAPGKGWNDKMLSELAYDPTNGIVSSGDCFRYKQ
jgi:hypothetical protein